jgi:hypothetical protein
MVLAHNDMEEAQPPDSNIIISLGILYNYYQVLCLENVTASVSHKHGGLVVICL